MKFFIVIVSVFPAWLEKVSLHASAEYDYLRRQHSKSYIKKHKGKWWRNYFLMNFKEELPPIIFYSNFFLGIWLLISTVNSIVGFVLMIIGYQGNLDCLVGFLCYIDIAIFVFRFIRVLIQHFDNK